MPASPQEQAHIKRELLRSALRRGLGAFDLDVGYTPAARALGYRRRARLGFEVVRERGLLGFRQRRRRQLIDVDRCAVLDPVLSAALTQVRQCLLPLLSGAGEISLALGRAGKPVIVLRSAQPQSPALYAACRALVDGGEVAGVAVAVAGATLPARLGDPTEWSLGGDGQPLQGTVGGFSQVHTEINEALVARVAQLARTEGQRVLELHAGHGNFSVVLARGASHYTAVEQAQDAVLALRDNLDRRGIPARVIEGDALAHVGRGPLDVALLDPPRSGAPGVLAALAKRKPARVVYVSCDPATLARDVRALLPFGYRLARVAGFDMFPQTADLESVVLLERA